MSEQNLSRTKRSSQAIDNFSFDDDFLVKVTELVRRNKAGTAIEYFSPATEEKQDAIIAAQNLGELAPLLRSILQYLAYPGVLDKPNNATRIIPIGGTVTTVTELTNLDGYQGKLVAINQNMSAWALSVRSRIS